MYKLFFIRSLHNERTCIGCGAIFEKRFELELKGTYLLSDFLDDVYLPWSKVNKKSWRDDVYMVPMLKAHFEGKRCEIFQLSWSRGSKLIA